MTKVFNAGRFVLGLGDPDEVEPSDGAVSEPVDRAMLTRLAATVQACTEALDAFDYTRALDRAEGEFWWWADNYVELVKGRAYESGGADEAAQGAQSAQARPSVGSVHLPPALRSLPPLRHRGGVVVVAAGLDPPDAVALGGGACRGWRPGDVGAARRRAGGGAPDEDRGTGIDAALPSTGWSWRSPPER